MVNIRRNSRPVSIAAGPDGDVWFTEAEGDNIGRITPAGTITEYSLPSANSCPGGIAAGPDGNLWFTEIDRNRIWRITPGGTMTEFPLPGSPAVGKKICPIDVTLHTPVPKKVGIRILTDKMTTKTSTCIRPEPVVLCRPLASDTAGEQALCDAEVTNGGKIRVTTQGYDAVRVTVIVRAKLKPGFANGWKLDTWRKAWILR